MVILLKKIKFVLKSILLVELLKGLFLTAKYFFKKKSTVLYPEEITPRSNRCRGLHALRKYSNGQERCIGCKLCEATCPALAIKVEAYTDDNGKRVVQQYNIDLFKCLYCGLCENACPVDAIVQTKFFEHHFENRVEGIITKSVLLENGERFKKQIEQMKKKDAVYK